MLKSQKKNKLLSRTLTYIVLILAAAICLFPFLWMISTSFKPMSDIYKMPPTLIPEHGTIENFIEGWKGANFQMYFKNTAVITLLATVGTVFSSSIVAYGFARFQSRMSKFLFMVLLGTMMLPTQVTLIPQYLLFYKMGMVDTIWPLVIPSWLGGGAFNIFLFIQFFRTLPKELDEAAKIDGANSWKKFRYVTVPLLKPTTIYVLTISIYAGLAMFLESFMLWNGNSSPKNIGLTIVGYLYKRGIEKNQMGYASAVGLVLLVIALVINVIQLLLNGSFKKEEK